MKSVSGIDIARERVAALGIACALAACGGEGPPSSTTSPGAPTAESPAPDPRPQAVTQNREAAEGATSVAQKVASCIGVLGGRPIADGAAQLEMTVDGEPLTIALDPTAQYPKNPVWDAGATPASCGGIQQQPGKKPSLVWVVQLHRDGTPVVRLQLTGVEGGETKLGRGTTVTGMLLRDGEPRAAALSFEKGTVRVNPDPVGDGMVEVAIDASGKAAGATNVPFTLKGMLSGSFELPKPRP